MWSTRARGFQRAGHASGTGAGAPPAGTSSDAAPTAPQQRPSRAAQPAAPPPPPAKARGHPALPAAARHPRRPTPSPSKPLRRDGSSVSQQRDGHSGASPAGPAQPSLKQAAAQARTERLRSALQQLRAGRGDAGGGAQAGSTAGQAAQPLHSDVAVPAPAPQPAAQHPPAQQAATAAPTSCTAGTPQAELDSDLEDLFEDVSLQLLARLRLGGQRVAEPALVSALPSGTLPPPQQQLAPPQQAAGAGVLQAARRALHEAAAEPEMPVVWRASGSVTMPSAAAPLQQPGLNSSAAKHQQFARLCPPLGAPAQAGGSAGRTAVLSPSGERRAELVLTRPPCRQGAELPAASVTLPRSTSATGCRAVLPAQPSSPYSGGGATPAARLAALLLQPERQNGQCSSSRQQLVGALPAPISLGTLGGLPHPSSSLPFAAAGSAAGQPAHSRAAAVSSNTPVAGGVACAAVGGSSGSGWQATGTATPPAQAGDILAEWRARRAQQVQQAQQAQQAQQGSSWGDRYSRFLSLRQPEPAAVTAASTPQPPASGGDRRAGASGTMSSRPGRPSVAAAALANGSTSGSSSAADSTQGCQQASAPDDGDILARWRARRRQQAQAGGSCGAVDLTPLLTLRMPGAAANPAVQSKPPADVEQPTPPVPPEPQHAAAEGAVLPAPATSSEAGLQQLGLAVHLPHSAASRRSSSMCLIPARGAVRHVVQQLSPKLSPAVEQACSALTAPPAVRWSVVEQPAAPVAPVASEVDSIASGQPAELWPLALPVPDTAAQDAAASELALALPASGAAVTAGDERAQAGSLQPSRPASAASSGRATPLSSLTLTSCGSAAWSPGISRLLDECIGGYFAAGSSVRELAEGAAAADAEGSQKQVGGSTAAASDGGGGSSSSDGSNGCGRSAPTEAAVDGGSTPAEACPDPADLPFLSAAGSPAAGCEKRPPPADGFVATARALLAEAVMLLDQPAQHGRRAGAADTAGC